MKLLWAISALSSFAILAVQGPALADDEFTDLAAKAKAEGEVTWYTAHFDTTLVGKIGSAFTAKYPGVKVNGLKATAQVSYQRLLQDLSAGAPQADVFSSTDASQFVELVRNNALEAYRPQNEKKIISAFQNFDPAGFYHVTAVSLVAITYNNQKISEADIPKTWQALLDSKWSNKIALGDPNFSGMVGAWTVTLQKMYGWEYFSRLSDSKR
jgi:iron(III) transport system substrate-binding protein